MQFNNMNNSKITSDNHQVKAFLIKSGKDSFTPSPKNPARVAIKVKGIKKNNSSTFLKLHEASLSNNQFKSSSSLKTLTPRQNKKLNPIKCLTETDDTNSNNSNSFRLKK